MMALLTTSCTNNLSGKGLSTALNSLNGTGTSTSGTYILNVTNVLKDSTNPTTTLDVIGDGTGAMGTLCTSTAGSNTSSTVGPSTCSCTYSYTSPSQGTAQVDVPTTYQESNLIECLFSAIPTDVTTVNVSVHVTSVNEYSNVFAFNLSNTGGTNPTLASNFVQVQHWQCRDIVTIPYPGSPALGSSNSIYDPIQSEDPSLSYPIDFYTTNLGGSLEAYINANLQGTWRCPGNPNDPNFGLNNTLYSVGADGSNSYTIYPTASGDTFDRSTFYVSKTQTGVYTIPLDAYTAPTLVNDGAAPLGYAAAPVSTGTNTEGCPSSTSVTIPSGFKWVKLWLFRANLPDRHYLQSSAIASAGTIACDPGSDSLGAQLFPDCGSAYNTSHTYAVNSAAGADVNGITAATANATNGTFESGELVNRVIAGEGNSTYEMCIELSSPTANLLSPASTCSSDLWCYPENDGSLGYGPGATYNYTTDSEQNLDSTLGLGSDLWQPVASGKLSSNTATSDPLDLYGKKWGMTSAPKDLAPTSTDLDSGNTRYDFVFVVSPTSVMAADMEADDTSNVAPYFPMRFPNASDCLSSNPNAPESSTDCEASKIKLHDVDTNGDPPASDPQRAGIYPMCVLQPI
jgi:hypothetical protein